MYGNYRKKGEKEMKYRIKVEVMQDGNSIYYPMLKRYWWSPWEYIIGYNKTTLCIQGDWQGHRSEQDANHRINAYKKNTVDRVYYIQCKEKNV